MPGGGVRSTRVEQGQSKKTKHMQLTLLIVAQYTYKAPLLLTNRLMKLESGVSCMFTNFYFRTIDGSDY